MNVHRSFFVALLGATMLLAQPAPGAAQNAKDVQVVATNNAFLDMHVYAVQAGALRSLGMVTGLSKATFKVSGDLTDFDRGFRILVDPIGGMGSYLTDSILVNPGDEIDLTIENNLDLSTFTVGKSRVSGR